VIYVMTLPIDVWSSYLPPCSQATTSQYHIACQSLLRQKTAQKHTKNDKMETNTN